ncbi:MAG: xanthine dehydrogenase family protein molybdopterin-binding subunit [Actinomycetota bacterium]|nr:xanthine dehydrogenase family protein molybdopterin-binding subunit [Actinomycetota bacterium]
MSSNGLSTGEWVGKSVPRAEDARHLTGRSLFVDDIERPRMLYAAFTRSPFSAARIKEVSVEDALETPGVEEVITRSALEDIPGLDPVLHRPEFVGVEMPLLCGDKVCHAGEPVAMILATSPHAAEDGAEAVAVEYDHQEPIVSLDAALAEDARPVHAGMEDNVLLDVPASDESEVDEVFEQAQVVVEAKFDTGRLSAFPLEGRACLAEWDGREDKLVLSTSTQVPHIVRTALAEILELPQQRIRVVAPDVGGGFGQKCVVSREELLVSVAAQRLERPVKWTEDRQENLTASFHGHQQRYEASAAFDEEGKLLALKADIICDVGAYSCYPFTCGVEPLMAQAEMPGAYRLKHYWSRARAVATNKAPMAPYRGVSRPQFTFVMERLLQKAAKRVGIDVVEIRRRNLVTIDEFPYESPTGLVYDPGSYIEALEKCAEALDFSTWKKRQEEARREGRLVGLGFSCFGERTGYGTRAFAIRKMGITPGGDNAHLRMDPSGNVAVSVGTCGHGQGHQTTLAQIAADELGIAPEKILVRQGDTEATPYGWGTFASRSAVIGGGATKKAGTLLAERIKEVASHLLEADPRDLTLEDGKVSVSGSPDRHVEVAEVARAAHLEAQRLPEGAAGTLEANASFDPPGTFSNATHGAIVEIDPETGDVRIDRYMVAEDCGVMINPMIVEGQVRGGVTQGIAAALYEQLVYDDEGQLVTSSLMDYLVPTATEIPNIEILHLETPCEYTETGAKGMGEGGTMGAPAAVASAVADALAHLDIEIDRLPITPDYLRAAIKESQEA